MKIAILGCGAMGSVYAGLLASAGHEVWAVDTWRDHVEAMRTKGLSVEGASGDRTVKADICRDPITTCSYLGVNSMERCFDFRKL